MVRLRLGGAGPFAGRLGLGEMVSSLAVRFRPLPVPVPALPFFVLLGLLRLAWVGAEAGCESSEGVGCSSRWSP